MNSNFPLPASERARALPIYAREQDLIETVRRHQVVVVVGPTGCGKTTQLPQMLLRAGITDRAICVTQPRRIAAVSVAWRIAQEQQVTCGEEVGYCIRFDDCSGPQTRLRMATDGILLQEAHGDPTWERYGVIVIDEAHERTLNIDFALGLLHDALKARPDLRVIVSSATMDPGRFVSFFADLAGEVPVIEIDARPHPVKTVWRPLADTRTEFLVDAVVREMAQILRSREPGHVLVFLPGEDAIKKIAIALKGRGADRECEIMTLYGAMQREEQERVFDDLGRRKVILATNIAETSITIDDVRFVIDSGLAKVPRFNPRTGITLLREEGISRASADQRSGRAGRTAPGTCIRLYSGEDFARRPAYTDEEILRLDLAETVLRLVDLGVRDLESFAFPTVPPRGRILAAIDQLQTLGALDRERRLTDAGRMMAALPLSPPLGRMVVEALVRFVEVADEVLQLAAWLSGRSAFIYPAEQEQRARQRHEQFADALGDPTTALQVLRAWHEVHDRAAFCARNFLDPAVLGFADHAYRQLVDMAQKLGHEVKSGGSKELVVRCVAAGFAQNMLINRGRFYQGDSDDRIFLHPGSVLFARQPRFVVATEIVVSARAYARQVAEVRGAWVAELRPDLVELWQLRVEHHKRAEGEKPVVLDTLQVGPVRLPVEQAKGRARVEIAFDQLEALAQCDRRDIPKDALRFQARIKIGEHVFAQGTPLGSLLAVLPLLPLPKPTDDLTCRVPEGTLLDVHRNRHTLMRHLDRLLQPMLPHAGKRPGWAALLCNGDDGYWYEVLADYREAAEATAAGLHVLQEQVVGDATDAVAVEQVQARVELVVSAIRQALAAGRGSLQ